MATELEKWRKLWEWFFSELDRLRTNSAMPSDDALRKSAEELQMLLGAVETHLRSQAVFGVAPPPPAPPPLQPPDDGLIAMIS